MLLTSCVQQAYIWPHQFIGASLSKPHTGQTASPAIYLSTYDLSIVCHSVNKCPRVLIHWTASILQCVINSVSAITFNVIENALILHVQKAYSMMTSNMHVVSHYS